MAILDLFRHAQDSETFPAGSAVFREGEPGHVMYVVKEGQVEVRVRDQVVAVVDPGGIVGEMALIDDKPRSATVLARTDAVLIPVDEKRFTFLVQQTPYFSLEVMRVMAERLRQVHALK
jgi:CRP-like cAMP-binding protein